MAVDSSIAADALLATWRFFAAAIPGGWARANRAGVAGYTGVAVPTLNGAWIDQVDAGAKDVSHLLDQVAATGMPYCLQFRPGASARLAELVTSREMVHSEDLPLMVIEDPARLDAAQRAAGLSIREIAPDEAPLHVGIAAPAFEVSQELFAQLMTPHVLAAPGVRTYVGESAGEPVATGLGITLGPHVGIFNIATLADHRRRGYGAAITARAVADGLAAGASWSWLQSSPAGYGVYEGLGFRTMESWPCWIAAPATR